MIRTYAKGSVQHVQPSFQVNEFDCKRCNSLLCIETLVDDDLALGLQLMHDILIVPIHIGSGFRCAEKQSWMRNQLKPDGTPKYETAKGVSQHELGCAADLRTNKHTGVELEAAARKAGFKAVGIGTNWIHVDTRGIMDPVGKIRRWTYSY